MTLLAIDPGRAVKASIGWALFFIDHIDQGSGWVSGEMTWQELCANLEREAGTLWFQTPEGKMVIVHEVVIENFVNNTRSRGGQTNGTSEVIGAVEILATQAGVPFTRQPNTILPVAKLHAGYEQKLKHLPHQDAAYLHGYYYLVSKGALQPKGLSSTVDL